MATTLAAAHFGKPDAEKLGDVLLKIVERVHQCIVDVDRYVHISPSSSTRSVVSPIRKNTRLARSARAPSDSPVPLYHISAKTYSPRDLGSNSVSLPPQNADRRHFLQKHLQNVCIFLNL